MHIDGSESKIHFTLRHVDSFRAHTRCMAPSQFKAEAQWLWSESPAVWLDVCTDSCKSVCSELLEIVTAVVLSPLRSLFPGLEGRFILDNLKPHLLAALKEAAQTRGIIIVFFLILAQRYDF